MISKIKDLSKNIIWSKITLSFKNCEEQAEYNFVLPNQSLRMGVSAMLRAKNEEKKIYDCLNSIFDVFTEIVFVDNGSTDKTLEIVKKFKEEKDTHDKIKVFNYPHRIARCGEEHFSTPSDSLHSLVYYYNWCLSKCTCSYVCKWDADMILHRDCYQNFKQLILTLPYGHPKMMILPIQTLYRDINNNYYLSKGEINQEPRIFPNSASIHFHKAEKWEKLQSRINLDWQQFPLLCIYELKDINEDEFAHWTNTDFKTERKNREYNNFQLIKKGEIASSQFEKHGSDFMTSVLPYPLSTQQLIKKTKNQELSLPAKANKSQDFEVIKTKFLTKILPYIEIKSVRHYLGRHNVNIWVLREIEVNPSTEYNLDELFKLRCIFFHIPKTAGLSVCDALFGNRGAGHINVSNARYIFGERNFRSFFKFCFVRNPWDRLVSSYHYLRKGGVRKSISPWIREKILAYDNFSEFVKVGLISTDVLNEQHFRPQYKFVCDKHDVLKVDFIGRFETLEPDFYKIIQELGIKSHLPHHNPSSREDFRQYYDDEMIEIVAKLYERDIQLFNYRFDS